MLHCGLTFTFTVKTKLGFFPDGGSTCFSAKSMMFVLSVLKIKSSFVKYYIRADVV